MLRYAVSPEQYDQSIPQIVTAKSITMDYLSKNPLNGTETVIDACCGTGKLAEHLGKNFKYALIIGLDNAENMIEFAKQNHSRENVTFFLDDLTVFNKDRVKSADIIICSWAVSHIPVEKQETFTNNLHQYLKYEGKLLVFFPLVGSLLSTSISEIVISKKWLEYFKDFKNKRMTYTEDQYDNLLKKLGFINTKVQAHVEEIIFKDNKELSCFVTTAVARYLPYLCEPSLCDSFIDDICKNYQEKVASNNQNIPYAITMLIAIAKKPCMTLLLQQTKLHNVENNFKTNSDDTNISINKFNNTR